MSVYPPGPARAPAAAPTVPPPPPRFSMTSACPSCRPSGSNTIRATMSIVLPALNGMITRIGLAGQLCAQLTRGSTGAMAAAAMSCRWRRRVDFKDVPPLVGHGPVPRTSRFYAYTSQQASLLSRDVVRPHHLPPALELPL